MAEWRLRDPGSFPLDFHRAMQAGIGVDKVVTRRYTHTAVVKDQRQWRLFRYSLRNYAAHPSAAWEKAALHRTRIAYNRDNGMWELLLTSRESVFEGMRILP